MTTERAENTRDALACPTLYGLRWCIKPLYRARNGEVWPHAGGHFFVTDDQAKRLRSGQYDGREVIRSLGSVDGREVIAL